MRVDRRSESRPVLLLNGLTRPLARWDPLVAALSDRTIIRFDPPGIGTSPALMFPISIAALAEIAEGVLDVVPVTVCDVLGYSHGGAVAQELCHRSPDRVGSLILASTTCGVGSVLGGFETLTSMLRTEGSSGTSSAEADPITLLYRSFAISCWSSIPYLGAISNPTLVISGDRDRLVPTVNGRILANRMPHASMATISAGHDLQHPACAATLAKVTSEFLDAHIS